MKKQKLLQELEIMDKKNISLSDVFNLYNKSKKEDEFMPELKQKIESVFEIENLKSKSRREILIVARSVFFWICKKHGVIGTKASKYIGVNHSSAINSIQKFYSYQNYYGFQTEIKEVLIWYNEKY